MSKDFEQVSCILCGNLKPKLIGKKGQFGLPTYVSICPRCGLVYLNPRWTKNRYDRFYTKEYDKYYRPHIYRRSKGKHFAYKNIKTIWDRLDEYNCHNFKSVLSIGSGMGWSLEFIRQRVKGISIAGIESSDYCSDNLINKVGGELLAKDAASDWYIGNKERFDLIIMRHVLEHFLNPISILQKVYYTLSPKGLVYIAVPDMMTPYGSPDNYWFRIVHTYYFSKSTLLRTIAKANLKPLKFNSEYSELWGIYNKGKFSINITSVYKAQIRVINDWQKKMLWQRIFSFFPRKIAKLILDSIKSKGENAMWM